MVQNRAFPLRLILYYLKISDFQKVEEEDEYRRISKATTAFKKHLNTLSCDESKERQGL